MATLATRVGGYGPYFRFAKSQLGGRPRARFLLVGVARALPGDQHAAYAKQRGGVLADDGQRSEGPSSDDVVRRRAFVRLGPIFGAHGKRTGTGTEASRVRQSLDHRGLPARGLDHVDVRLREGGGENEAREPGPGPEIGDPRGRAQ